MKKLTEEQLANNIPSEEVYQFLIDTHAQLDIIKAEIDAIAKEMREENENNGSNTTE